MAAYGCGNTIHENAAAPQESPLPLLTVTDPVPTPSNAPVGAPGVSGKMTPLRVLRPSAPKFTRVSPEGSISGATSGMWTAVPLIVPDTRVPAGLDEVTRIRSSTSPAAPRGG